jgi:hypothetical protein
MSVAQAKFPRPGDIPDGNEATGKQEGNRIQIGQETEQGEKS